MCFQHRFEIYFKLEASYLLHVTFVVFYLWLPKEDVLTWKMSINRDHMEVSFFFSQSSKVQGTNVAEQSEICKLQNTIKVRWQLWQTSPSLRCIIDGFVLMVLHMTWVKLKIFITLAVTSSLFKNARGRVFVLLTEMLLC